MKVTFILSLFFLMSSCIKPVKKDKEIGKISILEFSYSDNNEEILSFRVDSSKFYFLSVNDTILYGNLQDSNFDKLINWQETVLNNPEKFRVIAKCQNCPELVININKPYDTSFFVRQGHTDYETKQIIKLTRETYSKMKKMNQGHTSFETRLLIKPKPPKIFPVKF